MKLEKKSLGICIGASTVSFVQSKESDGEISVFRKVSIIHSGNPKEVISNYFENFDSSRYSVVVTGRKFRNLIKTRTISEPVALEKAIRFVNIPEDYDCIASLGGESFVVYTLNKSRGIENVYTGNKCASGTGEFFLQQLGRMDITVNEAVSISKIDNPYLVSGRCSVFCKSDCTHALNKGIEKGSVVGGLSKMIADKAIELLSKQKSGKIIIIGGVSQNKGVVEFLKRSYPDLIISDEALNFEALGASLDGLETESKIDIDDIFRSYTHNFVLHSPLKNDKVKVTFKELSKGQAREGDECLLGLDVGSTTTKAVIIRYSDNALLGSVYLRTNGNPVNAAIECYAELQKQVPENINIVALGTTGSGRQIAALHAMTEGVINEIIAHAVAAAHFDKDVDTIFEIGGQDAKYTHLTNGIASDYAMNEACSAGTGSFLEEASKESLNIYYKDIADIAFKSSAPINFNDQCAAFISSDIKNASHDGAMKEDIVAGLVYSICLNYVNRVKGNRPVGKKVFMQGGVCYNKAVPFAMANLIGKEIVVPPEPGLMGALGVALELKNRIELGFIKKSRYILSELIKREFTHTNDFICAGGSEKCDRKCGISIIKIEGKKYPFGGACNKYYNQRYNLKADPERNNYVKKRQELVFNKYIIYPPLTTQVDSAGNELRKPTIGISKSLLTNTLYPLYFNYFTALGFNVILSDKIDKSGIDKARSTYCYPVEIAHGCFQDLINKNVDYIFLPHITQMDGSTENQHNRLCVFVQGESYYLRSTFREDIETGTNSNTKRADEKNIKLISPVMDLSKGVDTIKNKFTAIAAELGKGENESISAFNYAYDIYKKMLCEFKELGREALKELESDKEKFGLILFGRAYNAFASEASLNIPHKIASKNLIIIPQDFLSVQDYESYENMYWYSGHQIIKSARFVKSHPQLFGVYITNFSCGPDSFIISYFRKIMGNKPSLTLELDSHSADVGVDTRIDAAIDIIRNYIELSKSGELNESNIQGVPLSVSSDNGKIVITDSAGASDNITSGNVEILIPSMGRYSTDAFAAVFRSHGVNCKPMPVPTSETLKHGRGLTTCKECLPFILTTGALVEYLENNHSPDKKVLLFMPHGYGPCRQGQYFIMLKEVIKNMNLTNVGVLSMDDENAFDDYGSAFFIKQWTVMVIADIIHDIESVVLAIAVDKERGLQIIEKGWEKLVRVMESGNIKKILKQLELFSDELSEIKLSVPLHKAKTVSLIGEIYVRREEFSRGDLVQSLIDRGFVVKTAPITEYVYYSNYLLKHKVINGLSYRDRVKINLKDKYQRSIEKKVKTILSKSGLCTDTLIDIDKTIEYAKELVSEHLIGETILTVGLALRDILDEACGIISIGPFNCIPSRMSEAILNKEMTLEGKYKFGKIGKNGYPEDLKSLPFLYVESDGNAFPQITQSKIEIFMIQAEKLHEKLILKHH